MSRLPIFVEALINEHRISGHPGDLKVIQDLPLNICTDKGFSALTRRPGGPPITAPARSSP